MPPESYKQNTTGTALCPTARPPRHTELYSWSPHLQGKMKHKHLFLTASLGWHTSEEVTERWRKLWAMTEHWSWLVPWGLVSLWLPLPPPPCSRLPGSQATTDLSSATRSWWHFLEFYAQRMKQFCTLWSGFFSAQWDPSMLPQVSVVCSSLLLVRSHHTDVQCFLSIHLLLDINSASRFWVPQIKMLWTFTYKSV